MLAANTVACITYLLFLNRVTRSTTRFLVTASTPAGRVLVFVNGMLATSVAPAAP